MLTKPTKKSPKTSIHQAFVTIIRARCKGLGSTSHNGSYSFRTIFTLRRYASAVYDVTMCLSVCQSNLHQIE